MSTSLPPKSPEQLAEQSARTLEMFRNALEEVAQSSWLPASSKEALRNELLRHLMEISSSSPLGSSLLPSGPTPVERATNGKVVCLTTYRLFHQIDLKPSG